MREFSLESEGDRATQKKKSPHHEGGLDTSPRRERTLERERKRRALHLFCWTSPVHTGVRVHVYVSEVHLDFRVSSSVSLSSATHSGACIYVSL